MRLPFAVFGLLLFPVHAPQVSGQELTCPPPDTLANVRGKVVDAQTQIPLGFVQLRLQVIGEETPREGLSDTSGSFRFCSVPTGTVTLSGQIVQMGGRSGPLELKPGETLTIQLELAEAATGEQSGTLTGTVVDAQSGDPLDGVAVSLPGLGQTVVTNGKGNFAFPSLPPGILVVRANRLGYGEATGEVEIKTERAVHTRVVLSTEPIALEPITVTAVRRRIVLPGLEEFERRYYSGWGSFILEEEIQRRSPRKLTDMLWETGMEVIGDGAGIKMRRTDRAPLVYVDGIKLTTMSRMKMGSTTPKDPTQKEISGLYPLPIPEANPLQEAADAVNLIHPMDVVAVEVYRGPAETPGEYLDSNAQCGVILVWTRRGYTLRH